jgi:PAS domain S-box-containing protein
MDSGKAKRGRKPKSTRSPKKRTKSKVLAPGRGSELVSRSSLADSLARPFLAGDSNYLAMQAPSLLAAIVDSSDDAIVSKNLDGIITSWNKSAERIFGYPAEEAIGSPITLIIPNDRWDEEVEIIRKIKRGERVDHFETIRQRKDGSLLNVSVTISPVKDGPGRIVGASKVARDITIRRSSEKALADRARQQRALFHLADQLHRAESMQDIFAAGLDAILGALRCQRASILLFDDSGVMRFVSWRELSEEYRKATDGHSPWKAGARNPSVICMDDVNRADLPEALRAVIKKEGIASLAFIPLVSAGELIGKFMSYFDEPHCFTNEEIDLSLTIARQIAFAISRNQSNEALRRSEERFRNLSETLEAEVRARTRELEQRNAQVVQGAESLRDLSRRMMQVQDEERRHIARELHDSAGQVLAVLGMNMGQLAQQVRQELRPAAQEILQLVQQLTQELRTMSYLLHPPLLDEIGLSAALNWYVQGVTERSQIDIRLTISENLGRLPAELELILFRLVQECLTNVHRHSGSKTATINVAREGDSVSLEVQDQGRGIPPERLTEIQTRASGVGVQGMRERVRQFHGEMSIESDETGTRIFVVLPVQASAATIPLRAAS